MKEEEYCLILGRVPAKWSEIDDVDCCDINKILKKENRIGGGTLQFSKENLNKIFIGMKGIIKLGEDKRKTECECANFIKLNRGIYATFEIIEFFDKSIKYKVKDNFFKENKIIKVEEGKDILGETKFNLCQKSADFITSDEYEEIVQCYKSKS